MYIVDDDRDTDLELARLALQDLDEPLELFYKVPAYEAAFRRRPPIVQVVDHVITELTRRRTGPANGTELVGQLAATAANVPTILLTNFKPDCDATLKHCDPRLAACAVEKPKERDVGAWRDALLPTAREYIAKQVLKPGRLDFKGGEATQALFGMDFSALKALDDDVRSDLEVQATDELFGELDDVWRHCDSDWVMLGRRGGSIYIVDRGLDPDLLRSSEVSDLEEDADSPCLIVGRPTMVEELGARLPELPNECSPTRADRDWRRYLFVVLSTGRLERQFHIDTGSPKTWMSSKHLKSSGVVFPDIRPKYSTVQTSAGERLTEKVVPLHLSATVRGDYFSPQVAFDVQAVSNWDRHSVLNPPCDLGRCPDSTGGQCGRRLGLVGRNLVYALGGANWLINGATGQLHPFNGGSGPTT